MKTLILVAVGVAFSALTSCNTIAGAGQDLQKGGAAVTGAARDAANSDR
jgi:entericidin B